MNEKICVVMSTYNGERFLKEQIDSILHQKDVNVSLFIRDDGSTDSTITILKDYIDKNLKYEIGDNCGAKNSFLRALALAPDADFYAFADQDDVWDKDKLTVAISMIKKATDNPEQCILYCGRTRLVDAKLNSITTTNIKQKGCKSVNGFLRGQPRNSAGCTMVFNKKLKDLVSSYMPSIFPMHDAWLNYLCLATGGKVIYDSVPHMSYRQHDSNVVGGKRGTVASIKRRIAFHKKMGKCYYTRMLEEIYRNYKNEMPIENIERYNFVASYKSKIKNKIQLLRDKEFFKGDRKYKLETYFLVLFSLY